MATETEFPATTTATKRTEVETPEKTLVLTTLDALAPASEDLTTAAPPFLPQEKSQPASGDSDEAASSGLKAKEERSARNGPTSEPAADTAKKIRRAERFGVPLQLSEQEKRNSRADRFGTFSGLGAVKSSEELKRKARAERFGPVANSAVDSEAKKKARLARFGSNAKPDNQEEEKRKARALRFAQSPAGSQTKTECKGNVELTTQKTAVTSSTIGGT